MYTGASFTAVLIWQLVSGLASPPSVVAEFSVDSDKAEPEG